MCRSLNSDLHVDVIGGLIIDTYWQPKKKLWQHAQRQEDAVNNIISLHGTTPTFFFLGLEVCLIYQVIKSHNDLFLLCRQSTKRTSRCSAAISGHQWDEKNRLVSINPKEPTQRRIKEFSTILEITEKEGTDGFFTKLKRPISMRKVFLRKGISSGVALRTDDSWY